MHKSLTLSDRTFIWDAALLLVKSKLFTGYGVGKSLSGEVFIDLGYMSETIFAHDIFLDYLVMGGIFALVVFILILLETQKEYKEMISISRYWKTFIWIGVLIYMCASIVEIYTGNYCLFLMIAYITFMYKVAVREKIESKDSEEGKKSQCTE
jgi:O-antigen ligase